MFLTFLDMSCPNTCTIVLGNSLCAGDHIPWRRSLDGSESRIQHMLMADDAQLGQIITPLGTVNFVQVWFSSLLFPPWESRHAKILE